MGRRVRPHLFGVGDEVWRQVAAIKLHTFNDIEFKFEALGFFNGDHAFFADLFHGFSNLAAHFGVAIGRECQPVRFLPNLKPASNASPDQQRPPSPPDRCRASGPSGSCRRQPIHAFANDGLARTVAVGCRRLPCHWF